MSDGGGDNAPGDLAFGGFLVKDQSGKLSALAINCSHLGCSVSLNQAKQSFDCPCHGSRFHLNGDVLHGPAAYPLSHLQWQQDSADPNTITVDGIVLGF
jgi:Rieske Fe-S protein